MLYKGSNSNESKACRAARYRLAKAQLWRAVRARWMLGGVLAAVTLAVLAPRFGAPGGNYCMLTI